MNLHVQQVGTGQPLCLLHGWALNGRVWDSIVEQLKQHNQVTTIDLPGHGKSDPPPSAEYTIDSLAQIVSQQLAPNSILAGWSLGGLVAIKIAAKYPGLVSKLVLIASSPQFANSEQWEHGVKKSIIDGFANDLKQNYRETINRFLAIQTFGSEKAKPVIRELRDKVFANGEPHIDSLSKGLQILKNCALWDDAAEINSPTLIVLGEKDTLIPKDSGEKTMETIPGSQLKIIKGAGHAPFISHREDFIKAITPFLQK